MAMATVLGLVPPFVGPIIYLFFRPPEYIEDVRERELEIRAMEERLSKRDLHCPVCRAAVESTFLVCPVCTTRLKQACVKCNAPLEALWQICPHCATPVVDTEPARDRRHDRRLVDGSPKSAQPATDVEHPGPMAVERTLILIKPDATERALSGEILARIERRGFTVVGGKLLRVSEELGKEHYAEHSEKPFFGELVTFITSAPTWALVVEGEGAIATMRKTIGATNPGRRRSRHDPRRLRHLDAEQPHPRLRLARVGRSARSRSGSRRMSSSELPEYAVRNRARWTTTNAEYSHDHGLRAWRAEEITWGLWGVPEAELNVLPDVAGKDVVELGCGTAYFSAWLARRGARPVGVDVTPAQLETARRLQAETGIEFPLLEANAEDVPLPDASFDLALSEYGASIWCDALPLDPGGGAAAAARRRARLPAQLDALDALRRARRLARDAAAAAARPRPDRLGGRRDDRVPPAARRALRAPSSGRLRRPRRSRSSTRPSDAEKAEYYHSDPEWAKRWPWEEIWRARKR